MATATAPQATYHQNDHSSYTLPNDSVEHSRLNQQSDCIVTMMKNKPFMAPIVGTPALRKAVDIGTGTGAMAIRLASENPQAKVYGVDLSPVPVQSEKVEFVTDEIRHLIDSKAPGFELGSFSYAFSRMLLFGMSDWEGYCKDLYSLVEPDGWAEMQEPEFIFRDATGKTIDSSWEWLKAMIDARAKDGIDIRAGHRVEGCMKAAGFLDVQVKVHHWTFSAEPWKEHPECTQMGQYSVQTLVPQIKRMDAIWKGTEYSQREIDKFNDEMSECLNMSKGGHMRYYAVCGRKPS